MKKFIFFLICFFVVISCTNASSTFYLGEKIPGIRYIMDKNGTKVFTQFKKVHKTDTDELVYCIEPGVVLSSEAYDGFENYNNRFPINQEQMDKVKLIANYGYLYKNHTDIKWYAITQYMIWKVVMPQGWTINFVDENKNIINYFYQNEIDEINNLIESHQSRPMIDQNYIVNYKDELAIYDSNNLIENYGITGGAISDNKIILDSFKSPGDYTYNLNFNSSKLPLFYTHQTGQDVFVSAPVYDRNISFNVHVTAGRVNFDECDETTFKNLFIGGTYEILDQDDAVIDEVTCSKDTSCLSDVLPIGFYKIRVKDLGDNFEVNEHIYDVEVKDMSESTVTICSIPKKNNIIINNNIVNVNTSVVTNNNIVNNYDLGKYDEDDNALDIANDNNSEKCSQEGSGNASSKIDTIKIPNTSKYSYAGICFFILLIFLYYFSYLKHESHI